MQLILGLYVLCWSTLHSNYFLCYIMRLMFLKYVFSIMVQNTCMCSHGSRKYKMNSIISNWFLYCYPGSHERVIFLQRVDGGTWFGLLYRTEIVFWLHTLSELRHG
ncbi:unnamed protein product [Triticum turgidum subsp. durum]|uniref:Uncharacterized protein n=1 Tax=Triticum turgidum subsp. durum TaxID=4567 RepID=A0A9R0XNS2_TRITD|nr:unnamed protein product [Triticum turgidum subsp. durum]